MTGGFAVGAQTPAADTTIKITFGGFVDEYYAWVFGRPPQFDRSFNGGALFTTQPARHDEFNVNLAFVGMKLEAERMRGRFALQAGTSVESNYIGEPTIGLISGPSLSRMIQEAVVGVRFAEGAWVDAGIFYSHVGMEGWVSGDNPTYTRSLVADYSPYYQSGVKFTWTGTPKLTAQIDLVNGWQNISENNTGKGVGIRIDYATSPSTTVSYYNIFSDESGNLPRTFNGIGAKATVGRVLLLGNVDVGTQILPVAVTQSPPVDEHDRATWWGFTAIGRVTLTPTVALAMRVERFDDPSQVVVVTGTAPDSIANSPFRGYGASLGIDWAIQPRIVWRSEVRGFNNNTRVFPNGLSITGRKGDGFIVTALTVSF